MTATTDNRELRDRHIAVLERILADHLGVLNDYVPDFEKRAMTEETEALTAAIALMRGQSDADKVLRHVWSILGPLPVPICVGCATEQTMALDAMRDYFGSNDYPAKPKDTADEQ